MAVNDDTFGRENEPEFPRDAKPWHNMLASAEKRDRAWHARCDQIDKVYACIRDATAHDREMQLFWANLQVRKGVVYAREPVPICSPRFRQRDDLKRKAADILERALLVTAEMTDLHGTLLEVRDGMELHASGVMRVLTKGGKCQTEYVFRRDFRHGPGRRWAEVPWVAFAAYLSRDEYKARFKAVPPALEWKDRRDDEEKAGDEDVSEQRVRVWEIWHKSKTKVVWVADGAEEIADARDPWWELESFWPMPKPAYGTLKPATLTPIPDYVYYQDQLEEINLLTDRIAKLTELVRLKGVYASGTDIGSAVERLLLDMDNRAVLEPLASMWQPGSRLEDAISWMPLDVVVQALTAAQELRRALMTDVYEVSGVSDIMRGDTDPNETLGAQRLKSQFGTARVRERQLEMQRVARDVFRIKAEIMAESYDVAELIEMAQVEDIPSEQALQQQAQQAMQQAQQAMQQAVMSGDDAAAQQVEQQMQQGLQQLQATVTVEKIDKLYKDQRLRPYALEVETDSTIEPDQMAEKQNRVEFAGSLGPMLQQGMQALTVSGSAAPQVGKFFAESLRYMASGFKVDRRMDEAVDELAEAMANYQPPEEDSSGAEQAKAQAEQIKAEGTKAKAEADIQIAQMKLQQEQVTAQSEMQKAPLEAEKLKADIQLIYAKIEELGQRVQLDAQKTALDAQAAQSEVKRKDNEAQVGMQAKRAEISRADRLAELDRKNSEQKYALEQDAAKHKFALEKQKLERDAAPKEKKSKRVRINRRDDKGNIAEFEVD